MEKIISKNEAKNLLFNDTNSIYDSIKIEDIFNKYGDYNFPTENYSEKMNVLSESVTVAQYII